MTERIEKKIRKALAKQQEDNLRLQETIRDQAITIKYLTIDHEKMLTEMYKLRTELALLYRAMDGY